MIWGVVLAGGASTRLTPRLGVPKGLVPLGDGCFLTAIVRALKAGGCEAVVVAVGAYPEAYSAAVAGEAQVVTVLDWPRGMRATLRAALRAVPAGASVIMTHVDRPSLRARTVAALIEAADGERPILPTWRGRVGHPILLPPVACEALCAPDDTPLRDRLPLWRPRRLPVEDPGIRLNINTPRACAHFLRHPPPLDTEGHDGISLKLKHSLKGHPG